MMSVIVRVLIITVLLENKLHVTGRLLSATYANEECLSENHGSYQSAGCIKSASILCVFK